jgi:hypothetical protein
MRRCDLEIFNAPESQPWELPPPKKSNCTISESSQTLSRIKCICTGHLSSLICHSPVPSLLTWTPSCTTPGQPEPEPEPSSFSIGACPSIIYFSSHLHPCCYARTLHGAMKCLERRESGDLLFYEQWVSN